MSGGSYEYVYADDVGVLIEGHREHLIESIADRVEDLGSPEVAKALRDHVAAIKGVRSVCDLLQRSHEDLASVMKAVEWLDSADWGQDQALAAFCEHLESRKRR